MKKFKKYFTQGQRVMGIDMETATIFITGFSNEINRGALLLVSDTPMVPEGIKTEETDKDVTKKYVGIHLELGIEAMTKIGDEGEKNKTFQVLAFTRNCIRYSHFSKSIFFVWV